MKRPISDDENLAIDLLVLIGDHIITQYPEDLYERFSCALKILAMVSSSLVKSAAANKESESTAVQLLVQNIFHLLNTGESIEINTRQNNEL